MIPSPDLTMKICHSILITTKLHLLAFFNFNKLFSWWKQGQIETIKLESRRTLYSDAFLFHNFIPQFCFYSFQVWEGKNAAKAGRMMMGETDPQKSLPGSIRGDFCIDLGRNIIHGSDSAESAEKEIALWFKPEELVNWTPASHGFVYEWGDCCLMRRA